MVVRGSAFVWTLGLGVCGGQDPLYIKYDTKCGLRLYTVEVDVVLLFVLVIYSRWSLRSRLLLHSLVLVFFPSAVFDSRSSERCPPGAGFIQRVL